MDYYKNVRSLEEKLSVALADENMLLRVRSSGYPYTINIVQDQSPEAQMELYSTRDESTSSFDSAIQFVFRIDGLVIRTDSRVIASDAFMNKIKGISKKLHYAFLQAYFAEITAEGSGASEDYFVDDDADSADDNSDSDTESDDSVTDDADSDADFGEFYDDDVD